MSSTPLEVIPIGGLGEIGKNMMALIYGSDALIIDTGLMFPENDMLGIDYIIPDFRYLTQLSGLKVRGIFVTHGHEDHTGAIQHVVRAFKAPIYATPLTRGLLEVKLRNVQLLDQAALNTVNAGDQIRIGPFTVETFHVCHSIPDGVGLGITTPVGLLLHSGDFKFDHTPVDGWPPDFAKLAEFSSRGVLALLSDSTNADRAGWTPSESVIDYAFDRVFRRAPGRIMVSTFASLISRIQQVATAAERYGRKIAIAGHTMQENIRMAVNLGYLELPSDLIVSVDQAKRMNPCDVVFMVTGTQGEPSSVLSRLAHGKHNQLAIESGDTVIMSSHPIPGNEEMVNRIINRLFQRGAQVIYDPMEQVHVSGHASQEEQKLLINLVRPRHFVPIHGELRHLKAHANLAEQLGIPRSHIAIIENGTKLVFDGSGNLTIGDRVPGGYVFVDGSGVGDIGPQVMKDREILARDGIVIVNVIYDAARRMAVSEPEIISRGFVFNRDSEELLSAARQLVRRTVTGQYPNSESRRTAIEEALGKLFYSETRRHPALFILVNEV